MLLTTYLGLLLLVLLLAFTAATERGRVPDWVAELIDMPDYVSYLQAPVVVAGNGDLAPLVGAAQDECDRSLGRGTEHVLRQWRADHRGLGPGAG